MDRAVDRIEETLRNIRPPSAPPELLVPPPDRFEGLGELGRTGERLASLYRGREVGAPLRKLLFIAAADHGASSEKTAIRPQESTAGRVRRLLEGRTPVARIVGRPKAKGVMKTVIADFGVKGGIEPPVSGPHEEGWAELVVLKVTADEVGGRTLEGTEDVTERAAMSRETALAAVRSGIEAMKEACSGDNVDLVGAAAVGLGAEVAACAIAAVLTEKPVAELAGVGSKRDRALAELVQKALDRPSPDPLDAIGVLSEYGGLDIGGLAGACLAAAELGLPVVLGGLVPTAAAAIALDLAPTSKAYFLPSDRAAVPAHGALLEYLGLAPLLALGLDVTGGEGVDAALGMEMVEAAWDLTRAGR